MPTPRFGLAAGVIDGILYAVGGGSVTSNATTILEAFTLPSTFLQFSAFLAEIEIKSGPLANDDEFQLKGSFTLGAGSNGTNPLAEEINLQIGNLSLTVPAGFFKEDKQGWLSLKELSMA